MSDAAVVAFLVLLGVELLTLGITGAWIWSLKSDVSDRDSTICHRDTRIRHLERAQEMEDNRKRVEKMNSDEIADVLNRRRDHSDLDDGAS